MLIRGYNVRPKFKMIILGQWLWLIWQSSRFRHQKICCPNPDLSKFYIEHLFTVRCTVLKRWKIKREKRLEMAHYLIFLKDFFLQRKQFWLKRGRLKKRETTSSKQGKKSHLHIFQKTALKL